MPCEPEKEGTKIPLFHMTAVKRIAQIGLPSMLQQSLVSLSMMMMQGLVNTFGKVLVAGYTAATKIDTLAMLPNMNISNAMSSFTAQNIGAGKYERVREGLKACILMVVAFSLLITIILFLFGNQLLSLFLDPGDTSGALGYGLSYMHTVSVFYILMGLLFVPNGMLRGAGDMGPLPSAPWQTFSPAWPSPTPWSISRHWGPTRSGGPFPPVAHWSDGISAPGEERKVDAQGSG